MTTDAAVTDLRRDLRAAGLRTTAPRLAVLRLLRRSRLPLSHGDVVARLRHGGWDRTTLYRNLVDLARAGLARRADLGDRVWRFEAGGRTATHRHPHFVCRECGDVACLEGVSVRLRSRHDALGALHGQEFEVLLKGSCDHCRRKAG